MRRSERPFGLNLPPERILTMKPFASGHAVINWAGNSVGGSFSWLTTEGQRKTLVRFSATLLVIADAESAPELIRKRRRGR